MRRYDFSDEPQPDPQPVHLTRLDVPFFDLTWFFVKSSLALALAFTLTSWLWVLIGTGVVSLAAGLLWLLGVPGLLLGPPADPLASEIVAPAPAEIVAVPLAVPAPAEGAPTEGPPAEGAAVEAEQASATTPAGAHTASSSGSAPAPAPAAGRVPDAPDPDRAATEALQRAELERRRQEREQAR